jgi:hypothetical protein
MHGTTLILSYHADDIIVFTSISVTFGGSDTGF